MAFLCYDIGRLLCQVSHRGRFFDWVPVEFLANVREVRNSGFAKGVRGVYGQHPGDTFILLHEVCVSDEGPSTLAEHFLGPIVVRVDIM